jgi:hypothetical protein
MKLLKYPNPMKDTMKSLSAQHIAEILKTLKARFEQNMHRHPGMVWSTFQDKLEALPDKLLSLHAMEESGGEPDVVAFGPNNGGFLFCDCAMESPKGRRNLCYDAEALASRKEHKPKHSAVGMAAAMGVQLITEEQYFELQKLGDFDSKTSSWLVTPQGIRKRGGAIFGDKRYGRTFIYHNGAESYYGARGFRALLRI